MCRSKCESVSLASEASKGPDKTKITYKHDLSVLALVMGAHRVHRIVHYSTHVKCNQGWFALQEALKSTTVSKRQWRQHFFCK